MNDDRHPRFPSPLYRRLLSQARRLATLAITGAAAFAVTAEPAFATPTLLAESGGRVVSRFFIGDHLSVGITGAAPSTSYQLRLVDEDGAQIETTEITTDAAGNAAPKRLWIYGGVVGCDLSSAPYAPLYRFQHFAEAEAELAGRTFQIEALDSDGVLAASLSLPLLAATRELAYFADAAGCLRYHFEDTETVYLALRHPNRAQSSRRIFLTPASGYALGASLADVRGFDDVQTWSLPPTGNPALVQLWSGAASALGSYAAVIRTEPSDLAARMASDVPIGIPTTGWPLILEGIMITLDGCRDCTRP